MITSMPVYSGASPRGPEPQAETAGIVESLRFAVRRVRKVRVGRTEITSKFVEGFTPNKRAGRHIEHTVFGIELVDRRAATHRVAFAEDLKWLCWRRFVAD